MKKKPRKTKVATKAQPTALVTAMSQLIEAELERLRGLLVERSQTAETFRSAESNFKTLADKADGSVADAKADVHRLEQWKAAIEKGATPVIDPITATKSMPVLNGKQNAWRTPQ